MDWDGGEARFDGATLMAKRITSLGLLAQEEECTRKTGVREKIWVRFNERYKRDGGSCVYKMNGIYDTAQKEMNQMAGLGVSYV